MNVPKILYLCNKDEHQDDSLYWVSSFKGCSNATEKARCEQESGKKCKQHVYQLIRRNQNAHSKRAC